MTWGTDMQKSGMTRNRNAMPSGGSMWARYAAPSVAIAVAPKVRMIAVNARSLRTIQFVTWDSRTRITVESQSMMTATMRSQLIATAPSNSASPSARCLSVCPGAAELLLGYGQNRIGLGDDFLVAFGLLDKYFSLLGGGSMPEVVHEVIQPAQDFAWMPNAARTVMSRSIRSSASSRS